MGFPRVCATAWFRDDVGHFCGPPSYRLSNSPHTRSLTFGLPSFVSPRLDSVLRTAIAKKRVRLFVGSKVRLFAAVIAFIFFGRHRTAGDGG